jgi:hypothetical protein
MMEAAILRDDRQGGEERPDAPPNVLGDLAFDANEARRKLREKRQDLTTLQLTADNHLPDRINSMHLENRLRDVETNRRNRLQG